MENLIKRANNITMAVRNVPEIISYYRQYGENAWRNDMTWYCREVVMEYRKIVEKTESLKKFYGCG